MKVEYPKWVYKGAEARLVLTEVDHGYLKAAGWAEAPGATVAPTEATHEVAEKRGPGRPRKIQG